MKHKKEWYVLAMWTAFAVILLFTGLSILFNVIGLRSAGSTAMAISDIIAASMFVSLIVHYVVDVVMDSVKKAVKTLKKKGAE